MDHWRPKALCLSLTLNSASCLQLTQAVCALVILLLNMHLLPLFFLLFTQVHLLIDGSVEGQYITIIPFFFFHIPHVEFFFASLPNPLTHILQIMLKDITVKIQKKILIRRRPPLYVTLAQANYYINLFHAILCAVGYPDMRESKYNTNASFILPIKIGLSATPWRISKL